MQNLRKNGKSPQASSRFGVRAILGLVFVSLVASACSPVYADAGESEVCFVFNDGSQGDGKGLVATINPEDKPRTIDERDEYVSCIPTSDRFWANVENEQQRDAGAAMHFAVLSSDGHEMIVQTKAEFVFNIATIETWVRQHLIRNTEEGHLACPVGVTDESLCQAFAPYDMGFNARGGLVSAWIKWLIEKFEAQMSLAVQITAGKFTRAHMHFNYPVGADEFGVFPTDAEGNELPVSDEDRRLTSEVFAEMLGQEFTRLLNQNLGVANVDTDTGTANVPFFCGVGHNQNLPEQCGDILVRVPERIEAVDITFVEERAKVEAAEEELVNKRRLDAIAASQYEIDQAQLDRESQAAIAAEARRLAEEAAQARELDDSGALEARRALIELQAYETVAPCIALGAIDGFQCAALLGLLPDFFGAGGLPAIPNIPVPNPGDGG